MQRNVLFLYFLLSVSFAHGAEGMHDEWVSEGKREADVVMQDADDGAVSTELPLDV